MGTGAESRKPPHWRVADQEPWVSEHMEAAHTEVMWLFGEPAMFTMMWRAQDHAAGLVDLCSECMGRSAQAFRQPERKKCLNCYGTTFEGGIRAQVIRPALFNDRNVERVDTAQGTVDLDAPMIETTTDFYFQKGDYVFRGDGQRYQGEAMGEAVMRTGFGMSLTANSFRGTIPTARLEDPTSIAFIIPPPTDDLIGILNGSTNFNLPDTGTPVPIYASGQIFEFTDQATWDCDHNLGILYPGTVEVLDTSNQRVLVNVEYVSVNRVEVRWPGPTSGKVVIKP